MTRYSLMALLSAVLLLGSCESQQAFLFRPAAATHSSAAAVAREPLAPALEPAAEPAPELTAEVPKQFVGSEPVVESRVQRTMLQPTSTAEAPINRSVTLSAFQVAPDTSLGRPTANTPLNKIKETDLLTKIVRTVGVVFILLGVASFITAFATTSSGWTAVAFLLYGFIYLFISIPFMLFRGKNSPRRQELERRRAARKATRQ